MSYGRIPLSYHLSEGGEGAEVVYPLRTNATLPRNILEAIGEAGQKMRKYYQRRLPENPSKDYYYIMRETPNTTSILIEYGFIDNSSDAVKLQNYLLDYVEGVVRAVANYIGIPYIAPGNSLDNTYTVVKGDTLYSISRRFNIPVASIKALNNLTSNTLSIGQKLILSEEINIEPDVDNAITYTVQNGDTLYRISRLYGVNISDLIELNNLNTTLLTPGQQILIPNQSLDETTTYTVVKGDTLNKIASEYGVTVDDLISSNNLTTTNLQIGQVLTIPQGIIDDGSNNSNIDNEIEEITYETYIVEPGDTLYGIANQFNTTVDNIKNLNNLTSNTLSIGQVLNIPSDIINGTNYTTYTVQRGDSLWLIASRFNTTVDRLKQINRLTSNLLQIGEQLLIP